MIYIIRDQIGNPVTNNLSLAGSKNSKLFAEFLANKLDVKTIITQKPSGKITDSQLENIQVYQTASKIAIYLGFKVVCYSNMKHALQDNIEFLENPKKTILIVWNHAEIPKLLNEILNHNKVKKPAIINWDSDNYNACIGLQKTKWRFFPQVIDGFTNDDLPHHKYNQDQNNSNSDDASETDASESDEAEHTQSDADEAEHTQSDADDAEEADEAEHAEHTQSDTESDTEHVEHGQSDADEAEHAESDAEQTKKSHKKETQVADSLRQAKQVQAAGSLRQAQQTHVADSLRQAQQTHVADSLRQAQQVHVADSLRQAKQVQAKQTHVADSLRQAQQAQAQSTNEDKINTNRTKMNKQERIVLHVKSPKSLKQLQQRKNSTPKARRGQSQTAGANQERNKTKPSTNMERNKTKSSTNKTKPSTDESSESNCSIQ